MSDCNLFVGHVEWSEQVHVECDLKSAVNFFMDPPKTTAMKVLSDKEIEGGCVVV
jgi:hypothetical protein